MKKILITGSNSYIGESVKKYLLQHPQSYSIAVKDTIGWVPTVQDFEEIDVVFNVAGIAHTKETAKNRHLYYEINRDLVIKIAKAAKEAGVRQFILLSSMSVYGLDVGHISKITVPNPRNAYGKSKLQADEEIKKLEDENFKFACLRPPMVYGKNCRGNYQSLRNFALKSPFFPDYENHRSMVYIGNLCEFVKKVVDNQMSGLFFPQNAEYVTTSKMVSQIAKENGKTIRLIKLFNWAIGIIQIGIVKKAFGSLTYDNDDAIGLYTINESITLSEK